MPQGGAGRAYQRDSDWLLYKKIGHPTRLDGFLLRQERSREKAERNDTIILESQKKTGRREKNRILLWFYDTLLLIGVWFFVLVLHPSVGYAFPTGSLVLYLLLAFGLYSAARFIFSVYKQILRYGSISAFSREISASILASGVFLFIRTSTGASSSASIWTARASR